MNNEIANLQRSTTNELAITDQQPTINETLSTDNDQPTTFPNQRSTRPNQPTTFSTQ